MTLSDQIHQLLYTVFDISISFPFLVPVHNLSGFCIIIPSVAVVKRTVERTITNKYLFFGSIAVHFMVETLGVIWTGFVGRADTVVGASRHSVSFVNQGPTLLPQSSVVKRRLIFYGFLLMASYDCCFYGLRQRICIHGQIIIYGQNDIHNDRLFRPHFDHK